MTVLTQSAKSESKLRRDDPAIHPVLTIKVRQRAQTSGQGQCPRGRNLTRDAPVTMRALRYNHGVGMVSGSRKSEWGVHETRRMCEPMKPNGCLRDRENQLLSAYGIDIRVQTGGKENLQERA